MRSLLRRAAPVAGLAAAVVPFAVLVHVVAELAARGLDTLDAAFVLRHLYLGVVLAASLAWYGRTLGLWATFGERVRRSALVRAKIAHCGPWTLVALFIANLVAFGLTQALEGTPIAAGSLAIGVIAGVVGSLMSAVGALAFGRTVARAVASAIGLRHDPRRTARAVARRTRPVFVIHAAALLSTCLPNRAPPALSFA
jgi:hypothetical protein